MCTRYLQILSNGQQYSIDMCDSAWTCGRHSGNDIQINHITTSRNHCVFTVDPTGTQLFISDNFSANGTYLNNERLAPGRAIEVLPGDVIYVGNRVSHTAIRYIVELDQRTREE